MMNSTMSGNFSTDGGLSGIHNSGSLTVHSCTLANSGNFSSIHNDVSSAYTGTVNIADSILAAEAGQKNCDLLVGSIWNSGGYNIISDSSCLTSLAVGDLINTDPGLAALADWGGPTLTHALLKNLPAVNHRPANCATLLFQIVDDQRHQQRIDGKCDTGAYEQTDSLLFLPIIIRYC
jgi:hypothetical protein